LQNLQDLQKSHKTDNRFSHGFPLLLSVCAGTVIALEAGGKCYGKGGKPFDADGSGQDLMGHHFFVIRGIADQDGVTGSEIQDRLAKQFFDEIAEEWEA
jgi:myo-inositol-1(or 4)-monophosphatase